MKDEMFVLVEASKLSVNDFFMEYIPDTLQEKELKEWLMRIIENGMYDFCRPKLDPSFNQDNTGICYEAGNMPAIGKSYDWWERVAKEFAPERNSRLGNAKEYVAFLGFLIKTMVSNGADLAQAWHVVCNQSMRLGNYRDSFDSTVQMEPTGSREAYGFYDLGNTFKILEYNHFEGGIFLAQYVRGFYLAGGSYYYCGTQLPLTSMYTNKGCTCAMPLNDAVGWIVLEC